MKMKGKEQNERKGAEEAEAEEDEENGWKLPKLEPETN